MGRLKSLVLLSLPVILAIGVTLVLQFTLLARQDQVTHWLRSFGPWFILAYALIQILTIVVAPLGGLFAQVAMIAILGPFWGLLLIYLISTPAYQINFFLSKKYGRPIVEKLIGKGALAKIDEYAMDVDATALLLLKVLQGGNFDYISYAAGLTSIPYREFTLVNFLGGIPSILISYFIFSTLDSLVLGVAAVWVTTGALLGVSILINHRLREQKRLKRKFAGTPEKT